MSGGERAEGGEEVVASTTTYIRPYRLKVGGEICLQQQGASGGFQAEGCQNLIYFFKGSLCLWEEWIKRGKGDGQEASAAMQASDGGCGRQERSVGSEVNVGGTSGIWIRWRGVVVGKRRVKDGS